jgi:hypothetical protein
MPEIEPAPDFRPSALSWRAASPLEDNLQLSAHRKMTNMATSSNNSPALA